MTLRDEYVAAYYNAGIYDISQGGTWFDSGCGIYSCYLNRDASTKTGIVSYFLMIYSGDVDDFCNEVLHHMNEVNDTLATEYLDIDCFKFEINDINNNRVLYITNEKWGYETYSSLQWANEEYRSKYGQIENDDIFKGYSIKTLYKENEVQE